MRFSSSVGIAAVVAGLLALNPGTAHGQLLGTTMSAMTTPDGHVIEVTYGLPLDTPGSPAEWLPHIDRTSRTVAADFRAPDIRLDAYNSRESADDIADVRAALGYERFTIWGRSYGTHLALATVLVTHASSTDSCGEP